MNHLILADSGSGLLWTSLIYLYFGNIVIGIGEAFLIIFLFKTHRIWSLVLMIPANFFSAWVGELTLPGISSPSIYWALPTITALFFISYLMSIVLEWPFIMVLFYRRKKWIYQSFLASLAAQTGSYAIITPIFFFASSTSVLTDTTIDPKYGKWADPAAILYFIDKSDHHVYHCKLDGSQLEQLSTQTFPDLGDRLFVRYSTDNKWDLYILKYKGLGEPNEKILLQRSFATIRGVVPKKLAPQVNLNPWTDPENISDWDGAALDLRPPGKGDWDIQCYPNGLYLTNKKLGRDDALTLQTPFLGWDTHHATVLSSDQVIMELDDQICILDINTLRLGLITRGTGYIVVY